MNTLPRHRFETWSKLLVVVAAVLMLAGVAAAGVSSDKLKWDTFEDGADPGDARGDDPNIDWDLPEWEVSSGDWSVQQAVVKEGSYALESEDTVSGSIGFDRAAENLEDISDGDVFHGWIRHDGKDGQTMGGFSLNDNDVPSGSAFDGIIYRFIDDGEVQLWLDEDESTDDQHTLVDDFDTDTWYGAYIEFYPSQNELTAKLLDEDGDVIASESGIPYSGRSSFDSIWVFDNGDTNVPVFYDDVSFHTEQEEYFHVPTEITINDPENQTYYQYDVPVDVNTSSPEDADYVCDILHNSGAVIGSTDQDNEQFTDTINHAEEGQHNVSVQCTDSEGAESEETVWYTVDATAPDVTVFEPSGDFDSKTDLPLEYTVDDVTADTCQYSVDGGANQTLADCDNSTFSVSDIGGHEVTVYAEDGDGRVGSDTSAFTTDYLNEIHLEDEDTSDSIDEFTATFHNGTATFGSSVDDGVFHFNTSDLPTGDTNLTLLASGYDTRTEQLDIDASFEMNTSFDMSAAGVVIRGHDEKADSSMPVNLTITNSTDASQLQDSQELYEWDFDEYTTAGHPTGDVTVTVNAEGYNSRDYFITVDEHRRVNLDTYLLSELDGIFASVKTVDTAGNPITGVQITQQRQFPEGYKTVVQGETGTDGTASFWLDPDTQYRVRASAPGHDTFEGTWSPANYQFDPLMIRLGTDTDFGWTTIWQDVDVRIEPDTATVPAEQQTFNMSVHDADGSLDSFEFTIYNATGHALNTSTVSGSPSGGSISLTADLSDQQIGETTRANATFVRDGNTFGFSRSYRISSSVDTGDYSFVVIMNSFADDTNPLVTAFMAVFITLVVSTYLGKLTGSGGGGIIALLVLGAFAHPAINWINPYYWMVTAMVLGGLYGMRRG